MVKAHELMKALRLEIEEISDAEDRSISECMAVVLSSSFVLRPAPWFSLVFGSSWTQV
jgi:hypothetical protein